MHIQVPIDSELGADVSIKVCRFRHGKEYELSIIGKYLRYALYNNKIELRYEPNASKFRLVWLW